MIALATFEAIGFYFFIRTNYLETAQLPLFPFAINVLFVYYITFLAGHFIERGLRVLFKS
jgi:hypothetical protein